MPAIRRERQGNEFVYVDVDEQPLTDERVLARVHSLGIPPAWIHVWISPTSRGHTQATGRDANGR